MPPRPAETRAVSKGRGGWASSRLDRRQLLKGLVGIGLGTATGGVAHGFLYERNNLELTRKAFPVAGLPEALRGLRLGVLTDVHRSQTVSHELVAAGQGGQRPVAAAWQAGRR